MYELHHGCNNKISTFPVGISLSRELKQRRRRRQQERQKSNRFRLAKQQLCTCITLFLYISLPSLHEYNVKVQCLRIQLQRHLPTFERVRIGAMQFEVARIHFLSDIFVAVAVGESPPSQSLVFFFEKICT